MPGVHATGEYKEGSDSRSVKVKDTLMASLSTHCMRLKESYLLQGKGPGLLLENTLNVHVHPGYQGQSEGCEHPVGHQ